MSNHTGKPDCPACEEMFRIDDSESDVEIALGVLEACVSSDMSFKEDVRFRLINLLAQVEGIVPPPVLIAVDAEEPEPETVRPTAVNPLSN